MWSVRWRPSWACGVAAAVGITCFPRAWGRQRPRSLRGCQAYFLISMYAMPSKVLRCTRWLASILPTPGHARFSPRSRLRMGASRNGLGSGRCVRSEAGLPARPGAVRRLLRLDRAVQHRWCGDRWAHDPRCSRCDDPGLRAQPAFGGQHRPSAAPVSIAVGCRCSRRRSGGTLTRRCLGGDHRLARPVLD
jgi:hypothetical protein